MNQEELIHLLAHEKEKNGTLILAHTYQAPDILAAADVCGDSYALAKPPPPTRMNAWSYAVCALWRKLLKFYPRKRQ